MILSAQFWPSFREEKLELPEALQKSLDLYTKHFETLKGNRTLSWKTHLGKNFKIVSTVLLLMKIVCPSHFNSISRPSLGGYVMFENFSGMVTLELELKDRKLELIVSPVHATIIWHFQEKSKFKYWLI